MELLAVLVLVVDDAFEPQAGEVLEDEVVVLGDAAERGQAVVTSTVKEHQI